MSHNWKFCTCFYQPHANCHVTWTSLDTNDDVTWTKVCGIFLVTYLVHVLVPNDWITSTHGQNKLFVISLSSNTRVLDVNCHVTWTSLDTNDDVTRTKVVRVIFLVTYLVHVLVPNDWITSTHGQNKLFVISLSSNTRVLDVSPPWTVHLQNYYCMNTVQLSQKAPAMRTHMFSCASFASSPCI